MLIKILDHNYAVIPEITSELKKLLSYSQREYNRRSKNWKITYNSLIDFDHNTTYTGLVPYIQEHIRDVEVQDLRVFPEFEIQVPELTKDFRDYQIDYLIAALESRRMIIKASGGLGKTFIMTAIIAAIPLPCLILAPNLSIMNQLASEMVNLCPQLDLGVLSSKKQDFNHRCVIGLAGSLINLPIEELRRFQVILSDECHTAPAATSHEVIMKVNAPYRFGFSATPTGRSDGKDLVTQGLFGPITELIERKEAVEKGYLAHTSIDLYRGAWEGNYSVLEDLLIVNNPLRNGLIKKIVDNHPGHSVLILVHRIEHGKILQEMFGKRAVFVSGDDSGEIREDVRNDVRAGKYKILIASKVFSAGIDIPNLEFGIFAAGGKSPIETNQSSMRVSRPWLDMAKTWCDIFDSWCQVTEEHSKLRLEEFKKQGIPVNFINFPKGLKEKLERD